MGQTANDQITIHADPDAIVDVITDLEAYPEWAEGHRDVTVLERDPEGRPRHARFVIDARVMDVSYTLEYRYEPHVVAWELVEGDQISQLDGTYVLSPGGGTTRVDYHLEVDMDLPLPGFLKKRAAKTILGSALRGLKKRVESG